jgi:hypothetical protein
MCERLIRVPVIGPIISGAWWQRSAGILQGPRFRCLARVRAAANLNRRPRDAPRDLQARQPLLARPVPTSGLVVLISSRRWERYGLKPWIEAAKKCLHPNGGRTHFPTSSPALPGRLSTSSATLRSRDNCAFARARGRHKTSPAIAKARTKAFDPGLPFWRDVARGNCQDWPAQ